MIILQTISLSLWRFSTSIWIINCQCVAKAECTAIIFSSVRLVWGFPTQRSYICTRGARSETRNQVTSYSPQLSFFNLVLTGLKIVHCVISLPQFLNGINHMAGCVTYVSESSSYIIAYWLRVSECTLGVLSTCFCNFFLSTKLIALESTPLLQCTLRRVYMTRAASWAQM